MAATGSKGNEARQSVGRGGVSFVLRCFHEVLYKVPFRMFAETHLQGNGV